MKNMANQYLGLSLFIMLLAFFIILNSISAYEETKSRPVLNSLVYTFSGREPVDIVPPGLRTEQVPERNLGSALDKLEALFKSQISSAETRQNRLGTTMFVRVPFEEFQKAVVSSLSNAPPPVESPIGEENIDILPMLVSLLETQGSVAYKMDMILNIAEEPSSLASEEPDKFKNYNDSVSLIARTVTEAGLPTQLVTSGMRSGDAGYMNLVFRRYEPFNPLSAQALDSDAEEAEQAEQEEQGAQP